MALQKWRAFFGNYIYVVQDGVIIKPVGENLWVICYLCKNSKYMAFKPSKLNERHYTLCGKQFQLYSIEGFSFDEPLDIKEGYGIYSFTKKLANIDSCIENGNSWMKCSHALIYLGKSDDFTLRPYEHDKFSVFKTDGVEFLGLYYCQKNENPKDIETDILKEYFFVENKQENEVIGNRKTNVAED